MCCEPVIRQSKEPGDGCSCGCGGHACQGPSFLSKKKKIQMVESSLDCLRERTKDLEELLAELKAEQK